MNEINEATGISYSPSRAGCVGIEDAHISVLYDTVWVFKVLPLAFLCLKAVHSHAYYFLLVPTHSCTMQVLCSLSGLKLEVSEDCSASPPICIGTVLC